MAIPFVIKCTFPGKIQLWAAATNTVDEAIALVQGQVGTNAQVEYTGTILLRTHVTQIALLDGRCLVLAET